VLRADSNNCCGIMLTIMSWLLIIFTLPFSLGVCLRVINNVFEKVIITGLLAINVPIPTLMIARSYAASPLAV